ncbi:MAG: FMN-binding protein [Spirochaetes bacterium]|nr:FMN-binding protein [Spirochaetota bacterium]
MKGNVRLGVILALFAVVNCASLAFVYSLTEEAIATQDQKALNDSLKEIFPEAASFEDITSTFKPPAEGVKFEKAFLVKSSQANLGVAIKATGASYGGTARLLVGVGLTRSIEGVRVLELNDTAGLGMNAKNASYYVKKTEKITFPGQFTGKFLTDTFEVKKDVAAITAATITSKSLTRIVKAAGDAAAAWLENSTTAGSPPASQGTTTPADNGTTGGK